MTIAVHVHTLSLGILQLMHNKDWNPWRKPQFGHHVAVQKMLGIAGGFAMHCGVWSDAMRSIVDCLPADHAVLTQDVIHFDTGWEIS